MVRQSLSHDKDGQVDFSDLMKKADAGRDRRVTVPLQHATDFVDETG